MYFMTTMLDIMDVVHLHDFREFSDNLAAIGFGRIYQRSGCVRVEAMPEQALTTENVR